MSTPAHPSSFLTARNRAALRLHLELTLAQREAALLARGPFAVVELLPSWAQLLTASQVAALLGRQRAVVSSLASARPLSCATIADELILLDALSALVDAPESSMELVRSSAQCRALTPHPGDGDFASLLDELSATLLAAQLLCETGAALAGTTNSVLHPQNWFTALARVPRRPRPPRSTGRTP